MNDLKPARLSEKFLDTAKRRLAHIVDGTEADLRRATSDLYYALFHRICECLVAPMGIPDQPEREEFRELFRLMYRLPDHSYTSKKCREIQGHDFSEEIKTVAQLFVTMRSKREFSDYDPLQRFAFSSVNNDLGAVDHALTALDQVSLVELARFAFFVSLRNGRKVDVK